MIEFALERFSASVRIKSSIRLEFAGAHVGWMTKTSLPRTLSPIWTLISPSLKVLIAHSLSGSERYLEIFLANSGFAVPEKILYPRILMTFGLKFALILHQKR